MPDVKTETKYYVKFPNQYVYLVSQSPVKIVFSEFFNDEYDLSKDDAIKIAERYSLEVEEHVITTTTEIKKTILDLEDNHG